MTFLAELCQAADRLLMALSGTASRSSASWTAAGKRHFVELSMSTAQMFRMSSITQASRQKSKRSIAAMVLRGKSGGYSHRNQQWVWRWAWTRIPHPTCAVQSEPPHLRQVSMFEQVCFLRLEGNQLSPGVSDPSPHCGWMNSCPSRIVLHAVGPERNIRGAVTHISTSAGWIMKKCQVYR